MIRRHLAAGVAFAVVGLGLAANVQAQTKWDLPAAYPATNFHSEKIGRAHV